jgi:hypothetical protein
LPSDTKNTLGKKSPHTQQRKTVGKLTCLPIVFVWHSANNTFAGKELKKNTWLKEIQITF